MDDNELALAGMRYERDEALLAIKGWVEHEFLMTKAKAMNCMARGKPGKERADLLSQCKLLWPGVQEDMCYVYHKHFGTPPS